MFNMYIDIKTWLNSFDKLPLLTVVPSLSKFWFKIGYLTKQMWNVQKATYRTVTSPNWSVFINYYRVNDQGKPQTGLTVRLSLRY